MKSTLAAPLSVFLCASACASDAEPMLGSSAAALEQENGVRLNGVRLNGVRLNGVRLNGVRLNGVRLNGVRLNGVRLNGSLLGGVQVVGGVERWVEGEGLVGAELTGELDDGSSATLRIDGVTRSTERGLRDVYYYDVVIEDADGTWLPTCGLDANGDAYASIAVPGVWDMSEGTRTGGEWTDSDSRFTFGCADGAIGKCVEWGYRPWVAVERRDDGERWTVPGSDYHQTCTRLARADYCGDGVSSTNDGTLINVYDNVGIETREPGRGWKLEAEWGPDGANCISKKGPVRHDPLPKCARKLREKDCGEGWPAETLVKTDLLEQSRR